MSKDLATAHKLISSIDWDTLYKDFKVRNLSYRIYYKEHFAAFLIKAGIVDYIPSYNTFYTHIRSIKEEELLALEEDALREGSQDEYATEENATAPDDNQIAVFDLDEIIEGTTVTAASTENNTATYFTKSSLKPNSGTLQLNIEYSGIKFSYPCLDPGRSLASLLHHIRELEEAHHAY